MLYRIAPADEAEPWTNGENPHGQVIEATYIFRGHFDRVPNPYTNTIWVVRLPTRPYDPQDQTPPIEVALGARDLKLLCRAVLRGGSDLLRQTLVDEVQAHLRGALLHD